MTKYEKIASEILKSFKSDISKCNKISDIFQIKSAFINKNGKIQSQLLVFIKNVDGETKKHIGKVSNNLKQEISNYLNEKKTEIEKQEILKHLKSNKEDITEPHNDFTIGTLHPLTLVIEKVRSFFEKRNFTIVDSNEIETTEVNFENLNTNIFHVVRDREETFYFSDELILRTHTTNNTARCLKKFNASKEQDLKIITTGNVYRRDTNDSTHSHQFMQIDGFCIGNYSLCDLIELLKQFSKFFFSKKSKIRLRPSYFPFTTPSFEVDVSCFKCLQKKCSFCKNTG